MEEDKYVIRIEPSSILAKTPSGRKSDVADLLNQGFLEKDDALALLGHPDIKRHMDLENADHEDAERTVQELIDGELPVPEPFQNLQLVFKYVQNTYLKIRKTAPEEIKENFRAWMEAADDMLAPPPVPGIGPVPQGGNIENPEEAMAMAQASGQMPPGMMPGM
jgi:hypothetical protein